MRPPKPPYEACPARLFWSPHKWSERWWDRAGVGRKHAFWGWVCESCGKVSR